MSRFKELGASLPQVLLLMSALGGSAYYYVKVMRDQEKVIKFAANRVKAHHFSVEISEALSDHTACTNTLKQNSDILAPMAAIYNSGNETIYQVGTDHSGGTLTKINLLKYTKTPGTKFTQASLRLSVRFLERRKGDMGSFGVAEKVYDIPIYLITKDDVVQICMSDEAGIIAGSLVKACQKLGGTYNSITGGCDNLTGHESIFLKHLTASFCSTGHNCPHPLQDTVCRGTDTRMVDHGNWVVTGFNDDGDYICRCMPRTCPNPATLCTGVDAGTDWCTVDCPAGTLNPADYTDFFGDDPGTICKGTPIQHKSSCGTTKIVMGEKDCGAP